MDPIWSIIPARFARSHEHYSIRGVSFSGLWEECEYIAFAVERHMGKRRILRIPNKILRKIDLLTS